MHIYKNEYYIEVDLSRTYLYNWRQFVIEEGGESNMPFLHLIITAITENESPICLTTSTV